MRDHKPFNLPEFMLSHFNRVDFGGNLFDQWPVGLRFEIGIKQVSRAAKLYELPSRRPMTASLSLRIGFQMEASRNCTRPCSRRLAFSHPSLPNSKQSRFHPLMRPGID
jgi:hypothetical protein